MKEQEKLNNVLNYKDKIIKLVTVQNRHLKEEVEELKKQLAKLLKEKNNG